jgi:hypothetical protein
VRWRHFFGECVTSALSQSQPSSRARGTADEDNKYLLCSAQFLQLQCNQIHSYRLVEEWISTFGGLWGFRTVANNKKGVSAREETIGASGESFASFEPT